MLKDQETILIDKDLYKLTTEEKNELIQEIKEYIDLNYIVYVAQLINNEHSTVIATINNYPEYELFRSKLNMKFN